MTFSLVFLFVLLFRLLWMVTHFVIVTNFECVCVVVYSCNVMLNKLEFSSFPWHSFTLNERFLSEIATSIGNCSFFFLFFCYFLFCLSFLRDEVFGKEKYSLNVCDWWTLNYIKNMHTKWFYSNDVVRFWGEGLLYINISKPKEKYTDMEQNIGEKSTAIVQNQISIRTELL